MDQADWTAVFLPKTREDEGDGESKLRIDVKFPQ